MNFKSKEFAARPRRTEFKLPAGVDVASIFENLVGRENRPAMLLESREVESGAARYTKMMVSAALRLECRGETVTAKPLDSFGKDVLAALVAHIHKTLPDLQVSENGESTVFTVPNVSAKDTPISEDERLRALSQLDVMRAVGQVLGHEACLYGGFAFDFIETFEPVANVPENATNPEFPDYRFFLAGQEIIIDHVLATGQALTWEDQAETFFEKVSKALETAQKTGPVESLGKEKSGLNAPSAVATPSISDSDFEQIVRRCQEHIHAGDIYQVVPSRSFAIECPDPLTSYRLLRESNPSPYLFYYRDGRCRIFGSSPESCLKVQVNTGVQESRGLVSIRPIAGTMPRAILPDGSIDHEEDTRRQVRLRTDAKETAEHLMLVDLARNDIARISVPATRRVDQLLNLELYSKVMHLVSQVSGQLRPDFDALDAYRACMNMGTLTGAPKIMATTLIRRMEKRRRGIYGGAIGYYQGDGSLDTCIAIRCAVVCEGTAHVQAGAGVVRDSNPQAEAQETVHKARAVLEAIANSQGKTLRVETGLNTTQTQSETALEASEKENKTTDKQAQ